MAHTVLLFNLNSVYSNEIILVDCVKSACQQIQLNIIKHEPRAWLIKIPDRLSVEAWVRDCVFVLHSISMSQRKTAVTPLLMHCGYCSLTLSHRYSHRDIFSWTQGEHIISSRTSSHCITNWLISKYQQSRVQVTFVLFPLYWIDLWWQPYQY